MFAMFFNVVFAVFVILLRSVSCVFTIKIGLDWMYNKQSARCTMLDLDKVHDLIKLPTRFY